MNTRLVEEIANAVLYEGYILYPYRASAIKNRKRFNFGVVFPVGCQEAGDTSAASSMQTECLVLGRPETELEVKLRFLHIVSRTAGELSIPIDELPSGKTPEFHPVDSVEVRGKRYPSWQEAAEREVILPACRLAELEFTPLWHEFSFAATREVEPVRDDLGRVAAVLVRGQELVEGSVEVSVTRADQLAGVPQVASENLYRVRVRISNLTAFESQAGSDDAITRSLVSTHTLMGLNGGEFISLFDPAEAFRDAAAACRNVGTFPVLAGEEGRRDTVLSSPIILYDYPKVAPESAGQFFDGTEIDEMLALRIMTLTDDEKREMGEVDERAHQLLERTESLPPEHMMKLHGALRGLRRVQSGEEERA